MNLGKQRCKSIDTMISLFGLQAGSRLLSTSIRHRHVASLLICFPYVARCCSNQKFQKYAYHLLPSCNPVIENAKSGSVRDTATSWFRQSEDVSSVIYYIISNSSIDKAESITPRHYRGKCKTLPPRATGQFQRYNHRRVSEARESRWWNSYDDPLWKHLDKDAGGDHEYSRGS
jgi:hypothetical protein